MYEEIVKCNSWEQNTVSGKKLCKNANLMKPLAMRIPEECRIMIVSQAPSLRASNAQILADNNNQTFLQFLNVLDIEEEAFHKYIYWTHYGKCYPGRRTGGDQWPTVHCANKFLKRELAECKSRGLKLVIGIAEPASKYLFKHFIDPKSNLLYRDIRNIEHIKDDLIWMFIKHTASTAAWADQESDRDFITILRRRVDSIIETY